MSDIIRTRREGGILEVTLDRPKANAIDLTTSRLMGETFKKFRDDPELRVAIMQTEGDKFFCAGWDLKAAAGGDAVDGDYGVGGFGGLQELLDLNKPVIAAVNGMAVGGGFELALSCDLIYASDHSSFALPEIRAGTLADAATVKLPKRIPYHVAMDLLLTGRWMDVAEALGSGQRGPAEGQIDGAGLGDCADAGKRSATGFRCHQGSSSRSRKHGLPGGHELDYQAQIPYCGYTLRFRRRAGRFQGLCGKA
jgi:1,4-dihydroxy-2-naphthoyl-CoA synthase